MRVLIAAGGTAGHINPALAIAGALKKADPTAEIHFAGRKEGMEYRLVTQAGYPFHHIEITGFQRKLSLHNIKRNIVTLWNLALSGPKAKAIMKEVQPDLVIGCGGYVSGPVVRCAAKMGIHTALHEQNAFPGVTNKLLAPDVDIVFAAVPAAVEKLGAPQKTIVVGNPVRPEVFTQAKNRDAIRAQLGAGDRTVILSFGGSLGARRVNEVVGDLCAWEQHEHKPVLHLHATGQYGVQLFKDLEQQKGFAEGDSLVVKEYINNMPELLAAADLVISRAGALTLAELEAVGQPQCGREPPVLQRHGAAEGRGRCGHRRKGPDRRKAGADRLGDADPARQAGRDGPQCPQPVGGRQPGPHCSSPAGACEEGLNVERNRKEGADNAAIRQ